MKKNFSTLSPPPPAPPPRHISVQNNVTAVSGVQTNPVGIVLSSYINFHVSENGHVIKKGSGSHSEVSWKTGSVFLSNCTMELVLGRSLDPVSGAAL